MYRAMVLLALACVLGSVSVSFAQADFIPSITDTISPRDWLYAGPFSVGAREGIAGVIDDAKNFVPFEGLEHRSILAQGGVVKWTEAETDSLGWLNLEYKDVFWDSLVDVWGIAGAVDVGYAYTEIESQGRRRALAFAHRPGSFLINGRRYYGNPYGDGYMKTPVVLDEGVNRVLVTTGGYGDHRLMFKLVPACSPIEIVSGDATVPDVVENEILDSWAGITVMNTTASTLSDVTITVGDGDVFDLARTENAHLEPLSYRKFPLRVRQMKRAPASESLQLAVTVASSGFTVRDSLALRHRETGESYIRTFLSRIDSSCQYYAVLPPKDLDPGRSYALILTLHGAGVEASRQADSYKPKDWAFIVAPTNRRRFGFDWQDWGRLDALEVLDQAAVSLPVDANRVYLVGHSMGGHGAWHVGLAHPDRFAAMAPAAGWTCFQLYVPWFLQKAYAFAQPTQIAIRDMSLREDFAPNFVENLLNLPVFILHGGIDDNVPTVHGRMFAKLLDRLGYEYQYKEVPDKGHWWSTDEIQCVDDPDLLDFLKRRIRNPNPARVVFKTTNLSQTNKSYWVEIDEQETLFFESRIEAEASGRNVHVSTVNVRQFTLHLSPDLVAPGRTRFVVNGKEIIRDLRKGEAAIFNRDRGEFESGRRRGGGLRKRADFYGPIKQAYFSPFTLVYGTKGDSAITDVLHRQAMDEAFRWWHRANGYVEVLADTMVNDELVRKRNLIVFGGPRENHLTRMVADRLPVRVEDSLVVVGGRRIYGKGLAAEFIYPNPLNSEKFVFIHAGTDSAGVSISTAFSTVYSGAGLPDFIVFNESVKRLGWGGVLCAGFFDADWKLDERLMYAPD